MKNKLVFGFGLLLMVTLPVFAQTKVKEQKETTEAYIFAEIGKANNLQVKKLFDEYDSILIKEFRKGLNVRAYIVNYGTDKEVAIREKQIQKSMTFRRYDSYRITFVRGAYSGKLKTVFWIVPEGAEPPKP